MSEANQVRINELARELEVKAKAIIDLLPGYGVTEKKTHSSSIPEDVAEKVRKNLLGQAEAEAEAEAKAKVDIEAKEAAAKAARMRPAGAPAPVSAAPAPAAPAAPTLVRPAAPVAPPVAATPTPQVVRPAAPAPTPAPVSTAPAVVPAPAAPKPPVAPPPKAPAAPSPIRPPAQTGQHTAGPTQQRPIPQRPPSGTQPSAGVRPAAAAPGARPATPSRPLPTGNRGPIPGTTPGSGQRSGGGPRPGQPMRPMGQGGGQGRQYSPRPGGPGGTGSSPANRPFEQRRGPMPTGTRPGPRAPGRPGMLPPMPEKMPAKAEPGKPLYTRKPSQRQRPAVDKREIEGERKLHPTRQRPGAGDRRSAAAIIAPPEPRAPRDVTITEGITIRELAEKLDVRAKDLLKTLLDRGVFASINQA